MGPLGRLFYLFQPFFSFLSFWTVVGRPGALACKGGVLLLREGLGFLKFRCTCHLLLFLPSTTLFNKSVSLQYGLVRLLPGQGNIFHQISTRNRSFILKFWEIILSAQKFKCSSADQIGGSFFVI